MLLVLSRFIPAVEGRLWTCGLVVCVVLVLLSSTSRDAWAQHRLNAVVLDAETRDPLSGAHVLLEGTTIGRVTNAEGRFTLNVQQLPVDVSVRHIGYETRRLRIEDARIEDMLIELRPATVELGEVFVTGETFAENLVRRVIERKQTWASTMHTYKVQGFSRILLERSGTIVHLSEATFDQYWDAIRGPRAVVTNHSRTADWYDDLPLPPAAYVPDLYRDDVEIQGLQFVGPTHPKALERYTFRLAGRRMLNEQVVCSRFWVATTISTISGWMELISRQG